MAKYRMIRVSFWEDPRVLEEMTPEDKYFYMYLMTNPSTTQIGIYQLTRKKIAFETGYSSETVQVLMDRFENIHKLIRYNKETREIALLNWPKYNLGSGGKPILDCVKAELSVVKDVKLIRLLLDTIPNEIIKNIFASYVPVEVDDSYHEPSTTGGQKEKEKEKEKEKKEILSGKPNIASIPFEEIVKYLNEKCATNFRASSEKTKQLIKSRWNEGYRIKDFQRVIDNKSVQWISDDNRSIYLRPVTLFGNKFESYLNEREVSNIGDKESSRHYGRAAGKSYEDVLKDVERDRKAWGGG